LELLTRGAKVDIDRRYMDKVLLAETPFGVAAPDRRLRQIDLIPV
jgi:hypothetical protein